MGGCPRGPGGARIRRAGVHPRPPLSVGPGFIPGRRPVLCRAGVHPRPPAAETSPAARKRLGAAIPGGMTRVLESGEAAARVVSVGKAAARVPQVSERTPSRRTPGGCTAPTPHTPEPRPEEPMTLLLSINLSPPWRSPRRDRGLSERGAVRHPAQDPRGLEAVSQRPFPPQVEPPPPPLGRRLARRVGQRRPVLLSEGLVLRVMGCPLLAAAGVSESRC